MATIVKSPIVRFNREPSTCIIGVIHFGMEGTFR